MTTSLPNYLQRQAYQYRLDKARTADLTSSFNNITLTAFKQQIYKRYLHSRHLQIFDEHLMRVARYVETGGEAADGIAFLVSAMPPRHGKSFTLSRMFPAWFLGRNPDRRFMSVSYGASLSEKHSRLARNIIASPIYQEIFPGVQLDPLSRAVDSWNLYNREGGMDAFGVLGSATGKGADILSCDDLLKNREEAESLLKRDKIWDAFSDDLLSRLEPGGAVILNATRWHLDDPTGRALQRFRDIYGDKMVVLVFPAIAEDDDPLNELLTRKPGDALWPERYPIDVLRLIERRSGPYSWNALYQQRPVPSEGGLFKRENFQRIRTLPEFDQVVRFWDLAMSAKTSADYTAGVKIGVTENGRIVIADVVHERKEWGDVPELMAQTMLTDGPLCVQGIEEKGYMSRAVQDLNADGRLRGYAVFGYPKEVDKLTNALPFAAKVAAGLVYVLEDVWTDAFIEELCSFTGNGDETDDQVDAAAGAWNMLAGGAAGLAGNIEYADEGAIGSSYY